MAVECRDLPMTTVITDLRLLDFCGQSLHALVSV